MADDEAKTGRVSARLRTIGAEGATRGAAVEDCVMPEAARHDDGTGTGTLT